MTFGKAHTINLKNEFTEEQLGNSMSTRHEFLNGTYKVFWKRGKPVTFRAKKGDRFLVITGDGFPKVKRMQAPSNPLRAMLWKYNFFRKDQKRLPSKEAFKQHVESTYTRYSRGHGCEISDYVLLETENIAVAYESAMEGNVYTPCEWWADFKRVTQDEIEEMEKKIIGGDTND